MPPIPLSAAAFPALWLFMLGLFLTLGVWRMRRIRLDVREDWSRLVRFHDVLATVEGSRGANEPARVELIALARALDETVERADESPGLAVRAERFVPAAGAAAIDPSTSGALAAALRRDVLACDRAIQVRMKASVRATGRIVPVFLSGVGAILSLPLEGARSLGLLRRLTARRVEESLWYHGALAVVVFLVLAGTGYAALAVGRILVHVLAAVAE